MALKELYKFYDFKRSSGVSIRDLLLRIAQLHGPEMKLPEGVKQFFLSNTDTR